MFQAQPDIATRIGNTLHTSQGKGTNSGFTAVPIGIAGEIMTITFGG